MNRQWIRQEYGTSKIYVIIIDYIEFVVTRLCGGVIETWIHHVNVAIFLQNEQRVNWLHFGRFHKSRINWNIFDETKIEINDIIIGIRKCIGSLPYQR